MKQRKGKIRQDFFSRIDEHVKCMYLLYRELKGKVRGALSMFLPTRERGEEESNKISCKVPLRLCFKFLFDPANF